MSGQIFISYRRDDASYPAGRLYDRLSVRLPNNQIFIDVNLDPGIDFVEAIETSVGSCDVLIAVIGKRWLTSSDEEGKRRLDNPDDFVRLEIATALKRNIRVIPILVDGALMPRSSELPDDLKPLVRRNVLEISHHRFNPDVELLSTAIESVLEKADAELKQREKERLEAEQREKERLEAEQREKERLEVEQRKKERLEAQKREKERLEAEQRERERLEAEQQNRLRIELLGLLTARKRCVREHPEILEAEFKRKADHLRLKAKERASETAAGWGGATLIVVGFAIVNLVVGLVFGILISLIWHLPWTFPGTMLRGAFGSAVGSVVGIFTDLSENGCCFTFVFSIVGACVVLFWFPHIF